MLMQNVEQRLFLLFWIGSYFMVKYMSIVIINKQKDNPMNNSMCHFAIAISIGDGGGNAIRRMLNRKYVTTVKWKLSLTNLSYGAQLLRGDFVRLSHGGDFVRL
jgi:hypothetical protein